MTTIARYFKLDPVNRDVAYKIFPNLFTYKICQICEGVVNFNKSTFICISLVIEDPFYRSKQAIEVATKVAEEETFSQLMGRYKVQNLWGGYIGSGILSLSLRVFCSEICYSLSVLNTGCANECLDISE